MDWDSKTFGPILKSFSDVLQSPESPFSGDKEYMHACELKFLLRNARELCDQQVYKSYFNPPLISKGSPSGQHEKDVQKRNKGKHSTNEQKNSITGRKSFDDRESVDFATNQVPTMQRDVDINVLLSRRNELDQLITRLLSYIEGRLTLNGYSSDSGDNNDHNDKMRSENNQYEISSSTCRKRKRNLSPVSPSKAENIGKDATTGDLSSVTPPAFHPRILRLCRAYGLSAKEREVFHLMIILQGSTDFHVLNSMVEAGDDMRRMSGYQRLCGMAEVDIEVLCDSDRQHIKEGMIMVEEENGMHFNLRCPRTAVQLLYGRHVRDDDLLKVSQTALEDIMLQEESTRPGTVATDDARSVGGDSTTTSPRSDRGTSAYITSEVRTQQLEPTQISSREAIGSDPGTAAAATANGLTHPLDGPKETSKGKGSSPRLGSHDSMQEVSTVPGQFDTPGTSKGTPSAEGDHSILPYSPSNQLEYLDECFQVPMTY
jgi:hypothetical protein